MNNKIILCKVENIISNNYCAPLCTFTKESGNTFVCTHPYSDTALICKYAEEKEIK